MRTINYSVVAAFRAFIFLVLIIVSLMKTDGFSCVCSVDVKAMIYRLLAGEVGRGGRDTEVRLQGRAIGLRTLTDNVGKHTWTSSFDFPGDCGCKGLPCSKRQQQGTFKSPSPRTELFY